MKTYSLTLSDEFAAFADQALTEGKFDGLTHLVEYALAQVRDELEAEKHQDIDALRAAVKVGLDQADRGEKAPLDLDAIWQRAQERLAAQQEAAPAAGGTHGPS